MLVANCGGFSLSLFYLETEEFDVVALSLRDIFSLEAVLLLPNVFGCICLDWGEMLLLMFPSFSRERDKVEVVSTVFKSPLMSLDFSSLLANPGKPSKAF